jgi:hypothetical protein
MSGPQFQAGKLNPGDRPARADTVMRIVTPGGLPATPPELPTNTTWEHLRAMQRVAPPQPTAQLVTAPAAGAGAATPMAFSGDVAELRDQLRTALVCEQEAVVVLTAAQEAVARAEAHIAHCERGLAGFSRLTEEVARATAALLRTGGRWPGSEPPEPLKGRVAARQKAQEALSLAQQAALVLHGELAAAQQQHVGSTAGVAASIDAILIAHSETLAQRRAELLAQADRIRLLVQALDQMKPGVMFGPVALAMLRDDPTTGRQKRDNSMWIAAARALREEGPDAEIAII